MRSLLAVLPLALTACGDLELKSVRPSDAVPAGLEGEWVGSWQSVMSNTSGTLNVQVQEFAGEPIVAVSIENPCITAREYELVLTPSTIELRADGVTVFAATLGEAGSLVGTYQCEADLGTWTAAWQRALPPITDLSGTWTGELTVSGQRDVPIRLQLAQRVADSQIVLDGALELTGLWPAPIAMTGAAQFREQGFDVLLHTPNGFAPELLLTSFGIREPPRMEVGLLQVFGTQLPFQQALVRLVWQGD